MANVLKMEKQHLIQGLLSIGWSYRRIERETGVRRETVAKYDPDRSKAAKVPTDLKEHTPQNRPKCTPNKPTRVSSAHPFRDTIEEKLKSDLSAQRIYQDLVSDHGFKGSYDSIKRYVRKLKKKYPKVFGRIHTKPGEEAQVDFCKGAPTLKNGRYVRPWVFKITLSFSRQSYEEAVWHQDVETFIRCHTHAFNDFGGVPAIVRLDNLKSGVLKANLYEPELNPLYAAYAKHAGFIPLPCLPGVPRHKGKTEKGVEYTKYNALKGRRFDSLDAKNAYLRHWNKRWARTRIHGTTKKQVWRLFVEGERPKLKPLPDKPFIFFKIGKRKVHPDGHVEVNRSYYSVPHYLVGESVTVHYNSVWVKVFHKEELVAFHPKIEPGCFKTEKGHLPANKTLSTLEYKSKLLNLCSKIGPNCKNWALKALEVRNLLALRPIQGVVRLSHKYTNEKIDWACLQAIKLDSFRYHTVKLLCEDNPEELEHGKGENQSKFLQEHEIIRSPAVYQELMDYSIENRCKEMD